MASIQVTFDFHLTFADAVGFVPVYLRLPNRAIFEHYRRRAFQLAPTPAPVLLLQELKDVNRMAHGNRLDVFDSADDLKIIFIHSGCSCDRKRAAQRSDARHSSARRSSSSSVRCTSSPLRASASSSASAATRIGGAD